MSVDKKRKLETTYPTSSENTTITYLVVKDGHGCDWNKVSCNKEHDVVAGRHSIGKNQSKQQFVVHSLVCLFVCNHNNISKQERRVTAIAMWFGDQVLLVICVN